VGDPETIGYRQALYLGFLALSVAGTALALALGRNLARRPGSGLRGSLLALAFLAVFDLVIFLVIPNNPDPIEMPLALVRSFQMLSLVGLTLFWTVLGFLFGMLLRCPGERQPGSTSPVRA
jgi:hypothetical protein